MDELRQRVLLPTATLWWREVVRFYRQRSRIVGALATPILFWILLGSGFSASFRPPGSPADMGYAEYFFPGTIVLVVLFTAIFSTISVIEDRREGFLQAVLVAPVSRASVVLGKILGGTTLALGQALLLLLAAPLLGIGLGVVDVAVVVAVLFAIAFGLTTLGFLIAWRMESTQGFHAIMNLVLMPMWFLSGAFFPSTGAPAWLRLLMAVNPLTYGLAALRRALYPAVVVGTDVPTLALSFAITCAFAILSFVAARALVARPLDVSLAS
ncbi:MAG TPA: ABC transporter permease [Candidatus Binatia bacterium]|nr:ABC transporter permease [Candidatus Binatia bacterium]